MKRITYLFMLLAVMTLACVVSAPSQVQPTPLTSATAENTATLAPEKPANKAKPTDGIIYVTASKWLHIRTKPNAYSEVVGYLMNGEIVVVYECSGVWARVGINRWVNSFYLSGEKCK